MRNDREHIKKCWENGEEFYASRDDECDKCRKKYIGLTLHVKVPEIIVLCEHCVPKKRDLNDRMIPYKIGDI